MTQQRITVIRGDGIGPDIIDATTKILDKVGCDFAYDYADAGLVALEEHGELLPQETLDLIAKNKVALKGPLTTPVGEGFTSINVSLRKQFKLYANLRPVMSFKGTKARTKTSISLPFVKTRKVCTLVLAKLYQKTVTKLKR